jgi:hypothetical protein
MNRSIMLGIKKLPLCTNCNHFIGDKVKRYGQCKLSGKKNSVTGIIEYKYASSFRINMLNCCGVDGWFFEEKPKQT